MKRTVTAGRRAPLRYVVAALGIAAAGALWFVFWLLTGVGPAAVSFLVLPLGAAVAAAAVFDLLRRAPLSRPARRFWRLMFVAFAAVGAGYTILAVAGFRDTSVLPLDDFGTGESSLSLLRAFPAAIIKLDKSFVDGIELDEPGSPEADARQAVACAVVPLARALGLDTVAEGIENQAQADRLLELRYSRGQGYHLARPMPAEAMTGLLATQHLASAL
ncbi:EAL domain-containing protein [Dactylosporangium sp. NPDC049140]|uniref:EAL domain-containing protein n=1 Tax=Dactylosporangium sp. NPDC049140 TaxID=3155647 RepID=UPI00340DA0DD